MVMLYSPIDSQKGLIKNAINQMIVDRSIQEVNWNGTPHSRSQLICTQSYITAWPPSTTENDKLSQILEHIKKLDQKVTQLKDDNAALDQKVNVQNGIIAQLQDKNAALKVWVGILEEDNQVLQEAIDGVSIFAWLGHDLTHNHFTANGSSSQTSTPYPAQSGSQEDPEPMGTSQS
jgi:hypothetical protein